MIGRCANRLSIALKKSSTSITRSISPDSRQILTAFSGNIRFEKMTRNRPPGFSTLATALTEAGLIETLKGEGPFTVFAPPNDAFAALPEGTVEGLLADIPALTEVLLYHVVPGEVMAADVVNLESADTVQGTPLAIDPAMIRLSIGIEDIDDILWDLDQALS